MRRIVLGLVLLVAPAAMAHGPMLGDHGMHGTARSFAAGEPGDPKKASRIVQITMRETEDGKMLFSPENLSVRLGEQVKFVLRNSGKVEHEFVLDTLAGNQAHKAGMATDPGMEHHDANAKDVDPAKTGELLWTFTKAGTFEFACLIPGHYEAGMKGTVTVK